MLSIGGTRDRQALTLAIKLPFFGEEWSYQVPEQNHHSGDTIGCSINCFFLATIYRLITCDYTSGNWRKSLQKPLRVTPQLFTSWHAICRISERRCRWKLSSPLLKPFF